MASLHAIWYDDLPTARLARGVLVPASWAYAGVVALRTALYERGILRPIVSALPSLGIGNLSVGGTGKTPVAAWAARSLRGRGAQPAIVLRDYGGDESVVHRRINPDIPVIADRDRARAVRRAAIEGADCVVLDDAFQHRRITRSDDWVLVAAEQWRPRARQLPAGPLREPVKSLRRASVVVVTRKTATLAEALRISDSLAHFVAPSRIAIIRLEPAALVDAITGTEAPLTWLNLRRVVAVAAIGAPNAFFAQLRDFSGDTVEIALRDHHAFDEADVARILRLARGRDGVVCTLKDAVKLAPLWPRAGASLWYVSQTAVVERGRALLDASLDSILAGRARPLPTADQSGPSAPDNGYRSSIADR